MAYDVTGILGGATRSVLEYGTGRLGDVSFSADGSGAPTNWTWDGATSSWRYTDGAALLEYRHVTIAPGVTIRPAGCPLAISGTLTIGADAGVSADGWYTTGTTGGATVTRVASAWLGGGTAGANGTAGGANGAASTAIASGAFGGRGGNGGSVYGGTTRTGGVAGAATAWDQGTGPVFESVCWHPYQGRSSITPGGGTGGGSGGSGGAAGTSCAGGGGGGFLVVKARRIVYSVPTYSGGSPSTATRAHFSANGGFGSSTGTGAAPAAKGGGGGGGAGGVVVLCDTLAPTDGAALVLSAMGGSGGEAWEDGASVAIDGGAGGSGGQAWIGYVSGPEPEAQVYGGAGGAGAIGGADGAAGSNGSAYLLSMIGR
jgi:hypothetical protein